MSLTTKVGLLTGATATMLTGAVFAATPSSDISSTNLQARLEAAEAKIAQLRKRVVLQQSVALCRLLAADLAGPLPFVSAFNPAKIRTREAAQVVVPKPHGGGSKKNRHKTLENNDLQTISQNSPSLQI